MMQSEILFLHDENGNLKAVQIQPHLWEKLKKQLKADASGPDPIAHDLQAFAEFSAAWSFPYSYSPAVKCPVCSNATSDWRKDTAFVLKNANIGGILVFECRQCGATLRQKYFKTHMDCDFTPPAQ